MSCPVTGAACYPEWTDAGMLCACKQSTTATAQSVEKTERQLVEYQSLAAVQEYGLALAENTDGRRIARALERLNYVARSLVELSS